jgi:hypothetical protein
MGDITGRPKSPAPQIVYVPQYSSTPAPQNTNDTAQDDEDITPEKQREKNLLSRNRSRLGTIFTGFRGILSPSGTQGGAERKTLLGE